MDIHGNAALGPAGRLALVKAIESGMTLRAAAAALNVAPATAHRWWHRWRLAAEPERRSGAWLRDRSSRPHRQPRRLSAAEEEPILRARRETNLGPGRLAGICRRARSTIWKVLHRHGLSQRRRAGARATVAMSGLSPERCCTSMSPAWRALSALGTR
jgi:transposase